VKGFKKCCISSALGEADDDMLWNSSEEEVCVKKLKALTGRGR
jgi:hypothetical protein